MSHRENQGHRPLRCPRSSFSQATLKIRTKMKRSFKEGVLFLVIWQLSKNENRLFGPESNGGRDAIWTKDNRKVERDDDVSLYSITEDSYDRRHLYEVERGITIILFYWMRVFYLCPKLQNGSGTKRKGEFGWDDEVVFPLQLLWISPPDHEGRQQRLVDDAFINKLQWISSLTSLIYLYDTLTDTQRERGKSLGGVREDIRSS